MKFFFMLTLAIFCAPVSAGALKVKVTLSPAGDFAAQSDKARGFVEKKDGQYTAQELTVGVGTFKTDIELRDKHFHERLGGKNAKIVLKNAKGANGKGTGTLVVNGKSKPVDFAFTEKSGQISAVFKVKASDFGIKDVNYLGVGVEDSVSVEARFPLR
jgi:polyisoprenoid-binding protein YceI